MANKTALIIGGSSSLAQSILSILNTLNVSTSVTYRKCLDTSSSGRESFVLDISKMHVIEDFLDKINGKEFDFVVNLIGSVSNLDSVGSYPLIKEYFEVYTTNLIFLLDHLFLNSRLAKDGKIVHMGSRAAKYGSFDRFYAASKSSIEGYIKSIPRSTNSGISINAISVGLILDSKMSLDMDVSIREQHIHNSGGKLLNCNQVAKSVVQILTDPKTNSGQIIEIGPQY